MIISCIYYILNFSSLLDNFGGRCDYNWYLLSILYLFIISIYRIYLFTEQNIYLLSILCHHLENIPPWPQTASVPWSIKYFTRKRVKIFPTFTSQQQAHGWTSGSVCGWDEPLPHATMWNFSSQPGWLGNLWSILVPAAGESWTTIELGMRFRVTWCNYTVT